MTVAVCFKCGEFKLGALTPCPSCGDFPAERSDIVTSVALTDHYLSNPELEEARQRIKTGDRIEVPTALQEQLAVALDNSGCGETIRQAEGDIRREVEARKQRIKVKFFDLAEEAFETGHSLVDHRDMITKEVGTLWSIIKNRFRSVDYTPFVGIAREIQSKAVRLENDVETFLAPTSDRERHFLELLRLHTRALHQYGDFLVEQAEFMYKKSSSVSAPGTSWSEWKKLLATEEPILRKCQSSGAELTLYYHAMNGFR
jgi:hypothetical protein